MANQVSDEPQWAARSPKVPGQQLSGLVRAAYVQAMARYVVWIDQCPALR